MTRIIEFQGRRIEVPDNAMDEDISGILLQHAPPPKPPAKPSTTVDAAESFASGIPRGLVETAMLPVTAKRLLEKGANYVYDRGDDLVRHIVGADPVSPANRAQRDNLRDDSAFNPDNYIYGAQDALRSGMDRVLHKPQTPTGKFFGTVGEFMAPGGIPSRAVRAAPGIGRKALEYSADLVRNAVVPGVASEAAGKATEGTVYEPWARVTGALAGNVGSAVARASNAPEAVLRRAVGPADEIDWEAALGLQNNSTGIRLTGPEAITQAQGGASALPNLQRVIEGSMEGRSVTAPFFAARPGQVDDAVGNVLDQIAPQSQNPSVLGPRASDAATSAIRGVEQQRTAAVQPSYTAANADRVPVDDVQAIIDEIGNSVANDRTGILSGPLNDLRGRLIETPARPGSPSVRTPVVGPNGKITRYTQTPAVEATPAVPITDIENLDRTRKYFRDRMDLPQIGQDAITKEQNAAVSGVLEQLDNRMTDASSKFQAGKEQYADLSRNLVQPIAEGPLGRVAAANDTAGAGNAILPQNPLVGSQDESADAVRRLLQQDPETTTGLVRQNLADRYSRATTETQEGSSEFAGAKFRKDIAGNEQRDAVLEAVLQALPDQAAAQSMPELLDVLQATGRRKPIGSATEFNRSLNAELGAPSAITRVLGIPKNAIASLLTNTGDAVSRVKLRNNLNTLANMFVDPHSVELIQEAIARGAPIGLTEAATRTAAQTAPMSKPSDDETLAAIKGSPAKPAAPKEDIVGLIEQGNVDLQHRPVVKNDDGSISTVKSISFEQDGKEILIPTISPSGVKLTNEGAIALYRRTGKHLGVFDNAKDADAYAQKLHEDQVKLYGSGRQ